MSSESPPRSPEAPPQFPLAHAAPVQAAHVPPEAREPRPAPPPLEPKPESPTLFERARQHPITALITILNVGWFLYAESHGTTTEIDTLLRFGAVEPQHVANGEFWRMGSYMFLHIGWVHLIWNSWAGASWCTAVERFLGPLRFLVVYLAAGIAGGAASVLFSPAVSAGASGAMFGMVGATLAIRGRQLGSFREFSRDRGVRATFGNIALWTAIGIFAMPMNHYAHFGGLLFGALGTWVAIARPPRAPKWIAFAVVFAGLVAAGAAAPTTPRKHPTPYTAEQIRNATKVGRTYRFRDEEAGQDPTEWTLRFVKVDNTGAEIAIGDKPPNRVSWEQLRRHAEFDARSVTTREESVTVPAGTFDCLVYVVRKDKGETSTYYFAKGLPGAPVLFFTEKDGTRVSTSTLLEHKSE